MTDALLEIPPDDRERIALALETGSLRLPATEASLLALLGGAARAAIAAEALNRAHGAGVPGAALASFLRTLARAESRIAAPDLVWSGPEVPGLHARDTRAVYGELMRAAERSFWLSTYVYFDGPRAFEPLARRMAERPDLEVRLLLNIQRKPGDTRKPDELVASFAEQFWGRDWPGSRRPRVYYNPDSLDPAAGGGVLHAKAVVVDDGTLFVTSANLTEAALDQNIELGLLVRDRPLALAVARHFQELIARRLLRPLPGS